MIGILRIGHRSSRDKRITTHVFLSARAFGADFGILCGDKDNSVLDTVRDISLRWGGNFSVTYSPSWKKTILEKKEQGYKIAHLTMYGEKIPSRIKSHKKILIVVGAEKVPPEIYELADYNISIGSQPHSEVAAAAVFLHSLKGDAPLYRKYKDAEITVIPQKKGKKIN